VLYILENKARVCQNSSHALELGLSTQNNPSLMTFMVVHWWLTGRFTNSRVFCTLCSNIL